MRLTRRVLALTGAQNLTQNGLADLALVNPGARHQRFQHGGTQIMGGGVGEGAGKRTHGGAGGGGDNDICHE